MSGLNFNYQNILNGQGFELAFAGMIIVFSALSLVSIFIALLPRCLVFVNRWVPEVHHHSAPKARAKAPTAANEAEIAAAIGYVLHNRAGGPA
ncbi:MAG: Na+-transporting methylmalonyl-CoA/oxaloacetate decarboxylase gamma subunit [Candidatus Latescibacterota bacterium]|jgi:Na+-transporting methylmalonyl-CoA/oxaloacetate decarboxylase gamma subunit